MMNDTDHLHVEHRRLLEFFPTVSITKHSTLQNVVLVYKLETEMRADFQYKNL